MARSFVAANHDKVQYAGNPVAAYPFTVALWFYPTAIATAFPVIAVPIGGAASGYWGITVLTGGAVRAQIDAQTFISATLAQSAAGAVVANAWHHLAAVFKSGANGCRIYVNGAQRAAVTNNEAFPAPDTFVVGGNARNNDSWISGRVAEVGVWNTELADGGIASLAAGVPPPRVRRGALVLYWPLHGLVALEPDLSGHSRGGTVTGATAGDHAPVGPYPPLPGAWR